MSMYDKSYCNCDCPQRDCERNIKYNPPKHRYFSMTTFDTDNPDKTHKNCMWKIKKGN